MTAVEQAGLSFDPAKVDSCETLLNKHLSRRLEYHFIFVVSLDVVTNFGYSSNI